jgi:predicted Zn-dependent peptidase
MPQYANTNWHNAHNFYGDLKDLDAATLEDVQQFFKTYYAPNNAAIAVVGDFEPSQALAMIKKYFGGIPSAPQPTKPDLSEPRQEQEKRFTKKDTLANRPAVAIAYHVPERNTPEFYAMGLLDQILLQGDDSWLKEKLVRAKGYTSSVSGGINLLGNQHNYNGPMLWMASLLHDKSVGTEDILRAWDEVIGEVVSKPVDGATLDRALIKLRSNFYDQLGGLFGFGRADLLASFALFDDDPSRINTIEDQFRKVTPELIQKTAREYLRTGNRTILVIEPKSGS